MSPVQICQSEDTGRRDFLRKSTAVAAGVVATFSGVLARGKDLTQTMQDPTPEERFRSMGYLELLNESYKDELWGGRFFALVTDMRPVSAREQALLSVLRVMEQSMQGHLAYLLKRHGHRWDARAYANEAESFASNLATTYGKRPWKQFNAGFEAGLPAYISKYLILRDKAPAQDAEILDLFVEHDQAYLSLAKSEQVGQNESSLEPVWRALEKSQRIAFATGRGA